MNDSVHKEATSWARVNGVRGLVLIARLTQVVYYFARIPDHHEIVETMTDYVGTVDTKTGDSSPLVWEHIPPDARIESEISVFYPPNR